MKALILGAGYGTRLYDEVIKLNPNPLEAVTKQEIGVAKALINIQGKPVIQHLTEKLLKEGFELKDIFVVTNEVFYQLFLDWANDFGFQAKNVVNNKTRSNGHRLGANTDVALTIKESNITDDLMVIAGDTLYIDLNLNSFLKFCNSTGNNVITFYQDLPENMTKRGNLIFEDGCLVGFIEKPKVPASNLAFPSLNVIKAPYLDLLKKFLIENPELERNDGHGFFIQWLMAKGYAIQGYQIPGRFDLGTYADCLRAQKEFKP